MAFSLIIAASFANSEICQRNNKAIPAISISKTKRQNKGASIFGIFFASSHLQKGKKMVARIVPINTGMKKSLPKYSPAKIRNNSSNFLVNGEDEPTMALYYFTMNPHLI